MATQFGDLTIKEPAAQNKFNNPGAISTQEDDDEAQSQVMFEENLAELNKISEDTSDNAYMDKVMDGF